MKASELRIGNLLRDKVTKTELRVIELTEQDIVTYVNDRSMFPLKDGWGIEPIPLTEERLLKFGFSREAKIGGDGIEFRVYHFDVLTFNTNHGWWYKFEPMNYTPLEYVHQLQNFYFALTGKELTLNQ
jgi:hypothetical protein